MWVARDLVLALCYTLRIFGVSLDGPSDEMCDNKGVVKNMIMHQYTSVKKHNAVNYHVVRKAAAVGIIRGGKKIQRIIYLIY